MDDLRDLCFAAVELAPLIDPPLPGVPRLRAVGLIRRGLDGTRRARYVRIHTAAEVDELTPVGVSLPGPQVAQVVAAETRDAYMVSYGSTAATLRHLLVDHGYPPAWHAEIDVQTEVGATLRLPLNRRTLGDLADRLHIDLDDYRDRDDHALAVAGLGETLYVRARRAATRNRPYRVPTYVGAA